MRSEWYGRVHGPSALAFGLAVISCASHETDYSCAPTLTCTLRADRFEPAVRMDAGPLKCDEEHERCRAEQIAAGGAHACGIARADELLCWGDDTYGQRGVSAQDAGIPLPDGGKRFERDAGLSVALQRVAQVAAGGAHTCALAKDDTVYCWGRNDEGQVDGVPSDQPVRVPAVLEIEAATAVSAGQAHSCAVTAEGVVCWGDARYGQSGREIMEGALEPGLVPGTEGATAVACGVRHGCALLESGRVLCWGELIEEDGGEPVSTAAPVAVDGLEDAIEIAAGAGQTCALREGGRAVCWGQNGSGQLGDGTKIARARPVVVQRLELSLHITAGGIDDGGVLVGHSCAQTKSFHAQCWGRNREGQLGIGRAPDSLTATVALGQADNEDQLYLDEVVQIAAGGLFTCMLDNDGPVRCWGDDRQGQLGLRQNELPVFGRATEVRRFSRP